MKTQYLTMNQVPLSHSFFAALLCLFAFTANAQAVESCLSRLWGGSNEETTYSPPYRPGELNSISTSTQPRDAASTQPLIMGQSPYSGSNVYVAPPSYTSMSPQKNVMQPVVTHQWSYSRITSTQYKPVQTIDPMTGRVSTFYRLEESKTLLPWLHRKEVVKYEPQPVHGDAVVGLSKPSSTTVLYDPCGNLVAYGSPQPIAPTSRESFALSEPISSATAVTYVTPRISSMQHNSGTETVPNYGTPRLLDPQWRSTTSGSDPANEVPTVGTSSRSSQSVTRPPSNIEQVSYMPLIKKEEFAPIEPFSVEKFEAEQAKKTQAAAKDAPRTRSGDGNTETESSALTPRALAKPDKKSRGETVLTPAPKTISLSASQDSSAAYTRGKAQPNYKPLTMRLN